MGPLLAMAWHILRHRAQGNAAVIAWINRWQKKSRAITPTERRLATIFRQEEAGERHRSFSLSLVHAYDCLSPHAHVRRIAEYVNHQGRPLKRLRCLGDLPEAVNNRSMEVRWEQLERW